MELILADNAQSRMAIEKYLGEKDHIVRTTQRALGQEDQKINQHLKGRDKSQENLIGQILNEVRMSACGKSE